jgi:ribA/ribD-fused uncharacterized protein
LHAVDGRRLACFFSGRCWLSNFYTSTFELEGNKYTSVEQYYQYCKAIEFKDYEVAQKILIEANYRPFAAKLLGRNVMNFGDEHWRMYCSEVHPFIMQLLIKLTGDEGRALPQVR